MKQPPVYFFKEEIKFRLSEAGKIKEWIISQVKKEKFGISNINFIFCSDKYLRRINKEYLGHDYFTDIVTFDNSISKKIIVGDIFISIDRVRQNSETYNVTFKDELHRVMAHGVLHLIGYGDKNARQKNEMRKMEDLWLKMRRF